MHALIEVVFHQLIVFVAFVLFFADGDGKVFFLHTVPTTQLYRDSAVDDSAILPTQSLSFFLYTGCNRRNGPDFGRVFLMLNYTEKPQNTYIQS